MYLLLSFSQSPVREPPPCSLTGSPQTGILRHQSHWPSEGILFIHSCMFARVPKKGALLHTYIHTYRKNIRSPSMEPHMEWRPTYNGVRPGFPRDFYNTAITTPVPCSLQHDTFHLGLGRPQPHWPACVIATLIRVCPPQLLPPPMWPRVRVRIHDTLSYRRGFGFMGAFNGIYNHNEFWNESKKCAKQFIIPKRNSWTGREWGFLNQDIHYSNFNQWLYIVQNMLMC